jgi:hypothetical protein
MAATKCSFAGWSGDLVGAFTPATVTIDKASNITVAFTESGEDEDEQVNPDLADVAAVLQEGLLSGQSSGELSQTGAAYLKSLPNVDDAGVAADGRGSWARLKNGGYELLVIDGYAFESADEDQKAAPPVPLRAVLPARAQSAKKMPDDPMIFIKIRSATSLPSYSILYQFAQQAGYTNAVLDPAWDAPSQCGSISWYKTLGKYSVVYLQTDCLGWNPTSLTAPPTFWALMTTDKYSPQRQQQLAADIQQGLIMPALAIVRVNPISKVPLFEHRYFVSQHFLRKYCSTFKPGSLVYIDGCGTWQGPDAGHSDLLRALHFDKKASVVLGWNAQPASLGSLKASTYLFSRMFGINPGDGPTPPNRPWSFRDSFGGLEEQGLVSTTAAAALEPIAEPLVPLDSMLSFLESSEDDDPLWVPSISGLVADPNGKRLHILGEFGDKEPTVTIDGDELSVEEWDEGSISAELGPADIGEVVVTVGDGHKSNPLRLSEWKGKIEFAGAVDKDIGPNVDGVVQARFRGEVADVRLGGPDIKPYTIMDDGETAAGTAMFCEPDSTFDVAFRGVFVDKLGCTWQWSGTAADDMNLLNGGQNASVLLELGIDLNGGTGNGKGFCVLSMGLENVAHYVKTCPHQAPVSGTRYINLGATTEVELEHYGTIVGGSGALDEPPQENITLTVPRIQPSSPADEKTPA